MMADSNKGIVDTPARAGVDETVTALMRLLQSNDVTLFAVIDHSGEAQRIGLSMRPTKLLIFGNSRAGTPLMTGGVRHSSDTTLACG